MSINQQYKLEKQTIIHIVNNIKKPNAKSPTQLNPNNQQTHYSPISFLFLKLHYLYFWFILVFFTMHQQFVHHTRNLPPVSQNLGTWSNSSQLGIASRVEMQNKSASSNWNQSKMAQPMSQLSLLIYEGLDNARKQVKHDNIMAAMNSLYIKLIELQAQQCKQLQSIYKQQLTPNAPPFSSNNKISNLQQQIKQLKSQLETIQHKYNNNQHSQQYLEYYNTNTDNNTINTSYSNNGSQKNQHREDSRVLYNHTHQNIDKENTVNINNIDSKYNVIVTSCPYKFQRDTTPHNPSPNSYSNSNLSSYGNPSTINSNPPLPHPKKKQRQKSRARPVPRMFPSRITANASSNSKQKRSNKNILHPDHSCFSNEQSNPSVLGNKLSSNSILLKKQHIEILNERKIIIQQQIQQIMRDDQKRCQMISQENQLIKNQMDIIDNKLEKIDYLCYVNERNCRELQSWEKYRQSKSKSKSKSRDKEIRRIQQKQKQRFKTFHNQIQSHLSSCKLSPIPNSRPPLPLNDLILPILTPIKMVSNTNNNNRFNLNSNRKSRIFNKWSKPLFLRGKVPSPHRSPLTRCRSSDHFQSQVQNGRPSAKVILFPEQKQKQVKRPATPQSVPCFNKKLSIFKNAKMSKNRNDKGFRDDGIQAKMGKQQQYYNRNNNPQYQMSSCNPNPNINPNINPNTNTNTNTNTNININSCSYNEN